MLAENVPLVLMGQGTDPGEQGEAEAYERESELIREGEAGVGGEEEVNHEEGARSGLRFDCLMIKLSEPSSLRPISVRAQRMRIGVPNGISLRRR